MEAELKGSDQKTKFIMEDGQLEDNQLERFSKEAARTFFSEFGLISHQINSFNQFVTSGLQELFDSLGEVSVEPGYDPSKGGGGDWRHASITYGKVRLDKPSFWTERSDQEDECLKLLPKHARLQNMTYSSKLKVEVKVQVHVLSYFSVSAVLMTISIQLLAVESHILWKK